MAVGLLYRARMPRPERLPELVSFAQTRAEIRGWMAAEAQSQLLAEAIVRRPDGNAEPRHHVALGGVWINPHFASDDLCLVFDAGTGELIDPSRGGNSPTPVLQDFALTRTTWADARTLSALIAFLEDFAAEDLASVEIGDPEGRKLARETAEIDERLDAARAREFATVLERPQQPAKLGGVVELLAPTEALRRREMNGGPLDRLAPPERDLLERSRTRLLAAWGPSTPGLDGSPAIAVPALERLTDLLLSHPDYRHEPEYLEREFSWDAGAHLGFLLIEALGGQWERVEGQRGPVLRVANLGGTGLVWRPFWSTGERLHTGVLYAHDAVLGWLAQITASARAAGLG